MLTRTKGLAATAAVLVLSVMICYATYGLVWLLIHSSSALSVLILAGAIAAATLWF